ncbi:MAG TPA: CHAD domain-containing protein [Ktedonobacteraceae bacterium]|nr:CHAD domain-containing protein [Ktedonobacteraceae bacterium]
MQNSWSPVRAAIDIGSNTIHIVVARATAHTLDILADEVDMVRIGESVTASGQISQEKCDNAICVLAQYKAIAQQHQARDIFVVATEAIRQASNSDWFIATVRQKTGLQINLISGNAEATLTFAGATYEALALPHPPQLLGVMDLGGGSTEIVAANRARITWKTSVPVGSGWLHDRFLNDDPPDHHAIAIAEAFLEAYFQGMRIKHKPPMLIVTGGSANSLLYLTYRAFKLEIHQTQLSQHDLVRCQGLLSALPAAEIAQRFEQPVERVRILLAGALIMQAVMERLHLDEIHVSPHGIREGILLARERYGASWLEKVSGKAVPADNPVQTSLPDLNLATVQQMLVSPAGKLNGAQPALVETFEQAGRRMLHHRLQKFLELPGEVLKHEDVEAVHKMRVASRRLRATLDAFESCCEPKPYRRVYRRVTEAADMLGAARDADVMLQHLQSRLEHTTGEARAGVQWLLDRLQSFRQEKQSELEHFLGEMDRDSLKKLVEACIPQKEEVPHGKS